MKSTLKPLMDIGGNVNTILVEMKSTMKTLMGMSKTVDLITSKTNIYNY